MWRSFVFLFVYKYPFPHTELSIYVFSDLQRSFIYKMGLEVMCFRTEKHLATSWWPMPSFYKGELLRLEEVK